MISDSIKNISDTNNTTDTNDAMPQRRRARGKRLTTLGVFCNSGLGSHRPRAAEGELVPPKSYT